MTLCKKLFSVLATLTLFLGLGLSLKAQDTQHTFTLNPAFDQTTDSTFGIYHLVAFDGVQSDPTCNQTPGGYNIWCGEVVHYAADPNQDLFDFNFPSVLLPGAVMTSLQENTVDTSTGRRSVIVNRTFSVTDSNSAQWQIQTTTTTNQYQSSCGGRGPRRCWFSFPSGLQPLITGTAQKLTPPSPQAVPDRP